MPLGSADGEPALYCGFVEGAAHVITTEINPDVSVFIIYQVLSFFFNIINLLSVCY